MSSLKIISWNVNGIRAIMKKDFLEDIVNINPDIICLQETNAGDEDAAIALSPMKDYNISINSSKARKGYSGTSILSKKTPINVYYDIGITHHDQEGRVIKAEFEDFNLIKVYVPNSGQELKRLALSYATFQGATGGGEAERSPQPGQGRRRPGSAPRWLRGGSPRTNFR